MKEHEKIKSAQANQLGSIDDVHPMKQITVMAVIQFLMLGGVGFAMLLIGFGFAS
mgnify:FL=1